ncbi:MAG: outer membrane protein heavy metal efflux system [Chthoniobacter sp.]|jgi:outer membrane protein TolC|nr:outer membrane protein heavy metal efflux system [Chthoniobacter sp.]
MKLFPLFLFPFLISIACLAESHDAHSRALETITPGPRLTLSAATQEALAQNRSIQEARARWQSMAARVPQAAAWDDLKLSTSSRLGRFVAVEQNAFTDHLVTVEQMIPVSGKNRSRARIAAAEAIVSSEELRRTELDVAMKVRAAFIRLENTNRLLKLNRDDEASLAQLAEISRARFEVGTQSQSDVLNAELERIRVVEARRDLERAISEQETQLKVLMNRDAFSVLGQLVDESPLLATIPVERLRSLILNRRPELRIALANVAAAEAKVELAKREWIPDPAVSIGAQRYNRASQGVSEVTAGISFNMPWLNSGKYRAEEREATANDAAAQRALEAQQAEALGLLRDQLAKVETFHHHVMLFDEQLLPVARQTVEASRAGYETNKTGFPELITARRSLREAEGMHRQHLIDFQIALAELEALVGADLGIFPKAPANPQTTTK